MKKLLLPIILLFSVLTLNAQQLAFPGAEGFGKFAKGARASTTPTVYHVTNLNDSGTGSLRDAISQPNRIIVFDVAGIIRISSRLIFSENLTVAGQTAPGDGVVVYGNGVSFSGTKDVIVRHMRFRMGLNGDTGKDAAGIANGTDMIFDHCSVTWGRDETFSISWDGKGSEPGNITIQNSIIGQGILIHSAGGLIQTNGGVTLYKNLYTDNKTRNPKVKGLNQYVNNVIYNWGSGGGYILGDTEGDSWAAIEGNYFIKGPTTGGTDAFVRANQYFQVCQSGNYLDYTTDGVLNGVLADTADFGPATFVPDYSSFINSPKVHPVINNKLTAQQAYEWIVDSVGPVLPFRDPVDKYIINELKSLGTIGAQINGEIDLGLPNTVGNIFSSVKQLDTDNDGMPDAWEDANALNKNNAADAVALSSNGYLNIENYVNSIQAGIEFVKYPTTLSIKGVDTDYVTLGWVNNATTSTKIVVEMSLNGTDFYEYSQIDPAISSLKISGLNASTSYYFRLKTLNGSLQSLYSASIKATTLGSAAPPMPSINPVPEDKSTITAYSQTTLQWTNLSGIWGGNLYYDVYFGTTDSTMVKVASAKTGTSLVVNIEPATRYYWRVDVTNLLGSVTGDLWTFVSGQKPVREKVAYFAFDETDGTTAVNAITGSATAQNFTPSWGTGVLGNAVTIPSSPTNAAFVQSHYDAISLGAESFSVELWFKSAGGAVDWYLFHKGSHVKNTTTGATGKWFGLQYNKTGSNDRLTWGVDDDATKTALDITGSTYFNNAWHHVVCIRDFEADQLRIYVDGVLKGSKTDGTGNISQVENLVIANTNVNFVNAFGGSIDEFSIYKGVLTPEEILDNYNAGVKTAVSSPVLSDIAKAYPNPFKSDLTIKCDKEVNGSAKLSIRTLAGQLVFSKNVDIQNGFVKVSNLSSISSGMYICTLLAGNKELTFKISK